MPSRPARPPSEQSPCDRGERDRDPVSPRRDLQQAILKLCLYTTARNFSLSHSSSDEFERTVIALYALYCVMRLEMVRMANLSRTSEEGPSSIRSVWWPCLSCQPCQACTVPRPRSVAAHRRPRCGPALRDGALFLPPPQFRQSGARPATPILFVQGKMV